MDSNTQAEGSSPASSGENGASGTTWLPSSPTWRQYVESQSIEGRPHVSAPSEEEGAAGRRAPDAGCSATAQAAEEEAPPDGFDFFDLLESEEPVETDTGGEADAAEQQDPEDPVEAAWKRWEERQAGSIVQTTRVQLEQAGAVPREVWLARQENRVTGATGTAGTTETSKWDVAIGLDTVGADSPQKPAPDHADPGNGRVFSRRLDSASRLEETHKSTKSERPEQPTKQAQPPEKAQLKGYMRTKMTGTTAQSNLLDSWCSCEAQRELVIHLFHSWLLYWSDLQPICARLMRRDLTGCPDETERVWKPLKERGVLWTDGKYHSARGESRTFRLTRRAAAALAEAGREGKPDARKLHSGKRDQADPALGMALYDSSRHRWKRTSDILGGALEALGDAEQTLDRSASEAIRCLLVEEKKQAEKRRERAAEALLLAGGLQPKRDYKKADAAYTSATCRLAAFDHSEHVIERQMVREEDSGGLTRIQNAYEVQEISGRLSFKQGGTQGLMGVVKALYYDQMVLRNYDICSSQTEALRELADKLQGAGADVDTTALDEYLE